MGKKALRTIAQTVEAMPGKLQTAPAIHPFCECMADPEAAPPCRLPDEYVSPTTALKLTNEYTLTSDAAGSLVAAVYPGLQRSDYVWTVTAGVSSAGTTYAAHPDYTEMVGAFDQGRIVAFQVTVTYVGAAQTASGRLVTIEAPDISSFNSATLAAIVDDGDSAQAQAGRIHRLRPSQPPRFELINQATGFMVPTYPSLGIVGVGLPPSTVCFSVRVTRHMEFIPKRASAWRGAAMIEPFNPDAIAMAANMGTAGKTGTIAEKSSLKSTAMLAANTAWNALGPQVTDAVNKYGPQAAGWAAAKLITMI